MSENRYYLLDWHARVMDHDPTQDRIVMEDLRADRYPGLWFTTPNPDALPFALTLQKSVSRPMPLPAFEAVEAPEGTIALREEGRSTYCSALPERVLRPGSEVIAGWERYTLLSTMMLHGILVLAQPHFSRLTTQDGEALPALTLGDGFKAWFGALEIPLPVLTQALEAAGSLIPGQSIAIATGDDKNPAIIVERL